MKRIVSAVLLTAMLLTSSLSAVGCAKDNGGTISRPATSTPAETDPNKGLSSDGTTNIHDVVFGRYGLVLDFVGNMAYIGNVSRVNFGYLLGKTSPGQVTVMPELEAAMEDCGEKTVFAVHVMAFEKDCTVDDLKITKKSELGKMITAGIQFDGFDRYVAMGKVFFLTSDEISSLSCPADKRMVCGMAVYDEVWKEKNKEFGEAVDGLSDGKTLPVYVYYNNDFENSVAFSDEILQNEGKIAERIEKYHNYVNSEDFGKLVTDGTVQKGLEDLVKKLDIKENVIYIPHLSRLQTRMTAEQIKNLPDGYSVEVRY